MVFQKTRVLVCGSRDWDNDFVLGAFLAALDERYKFSYVIEGEAKGADSMAREWARRRWIPVLKFPADWAKHGKQAGPIRNQEMLVIGEPDLVVAFSDHLATSFGTQDMLRRAIAAKIPVRVFTSRGEILDR